MATSRYGTEAATRAASRVAEALGSEVPVAGIILGSGLGGLAERFDGSRAISFKSVPGFPSATVVGHSGKIIAGMLGGRPVIALAGRFHMYEGHEAALAGFAVRVLHALGVRTLFVSNAAGGIRRSFRGGELMLIRDHINLTFRNPLIGPLEDGDERFPDMSDAYDPLLRDQLRAHALALGTPLEEGVYGGLLGPSYETPAEVRMLAMLGVDAVGMSTVPEVIVARARGMRVAGISCVTNAAAGYAGHPLSHEEVLGVGQSVRERFEPLVERFVSNV